MQPVLQTITVAKSLTPKYFCIYINIYISAHFTIVENFYLLFVEFKFSLSTYHSYDGHTKTGVYVYV
jgi:hypothetical protein